MDDCLFDERLNALLLCHIEIQRLCLATITIYIGSGFLRALDIDVSEITRQYMDYIGAVEAMRFELDQTGDVLCFPINISLPKVNLSSFPVIKSLT